MTPAASEPHPDEHLQETDLRVGPAPAPEPAPELPRPRRGGPSKKQSSTFAAAAWTPPTPEAPAEEPAPPPVDATAPTATPPATAPGAIPGWGQTSPTATPAPPPVAPVAPPPVTPAQPPPVSPMAAQPPPVAPVARPPQAAAQPASRAPQPVDDQPQSRLPTAEVTQKPRPVASVEQRVAQPGDRICGSCAEPNDPSRKFCRRCGAGLGEAKIVAAAAVPWYRRLFGGKKEPKQYAAGERTKTTTKTAQTTGGIRGLLKSVGFVRAGLGVIVAIGIFGYVGIPSFRSILDRAADPIMRGGPDPDHRQHQVPRGPRVQERHARPERRDRHRRRR